MRGTDGPNTLSTHQGLGLGHSENLCPTSPQIMQALVLRRLLYSSLVSLPLALFQDSKDSSFSNRERKIFVALPIRHQVGAKGAVFKASDVNVHRGLNANAVFPIGVRAVKLMGVVSERLIALLNSNKRI